MFPCFFGIIFCLNTFSVSTAGVVCLTRKYCKVFYADTQHFFAVAMCLTVLVMLQIAKTHVHKYSYVHSYAVVCVGITRYVLWPTNRRNIFSHSIMGHLIF